jgi:hypothetical protein
MKWTSKFLLAPVVGAMLWLPTTVHTCADEFPEAVSTRGKGPDKPMADFAGGKIGIILPTWQRAYLTVAYRYFEGKSLHESEQHSFMEFWDGNGAVNRSPDTKPIEEWLSERAKYKKTAPPEELSQYKSTNFAYVSNCAPPAFRTAAETLRDRASKYGASSPDLAEWIDGQDMVFQDCTKGIIVPAALPATVNPTLRADRAYQIAAAHFYKGDSEVARKELEEIAADKSSPWHEIAPYLVARTWIRQAEQSAPEDWTYNQEVLKNAEPVLWAIMQDTHSPIRHDAERLMALVRYHAYPQQRLHELAELLSADRSGDDFGQQLRDYTMMLNRTLDADPDFPGVEHWGAKYKQFKKEWELKRYTELTQERADDLGDWLVTFQSESQAAKAHAVERWRNSQSMPWLAAAMGKASGADEAAKELLAAAAKTTASSPAYLTIAYHQARLEREQGHDEAARLTLATALKHRAELPPSSVNLLEDEMSLVADSLNAFTRLIGRTPAEVSSECSNWDSEIDVVCAQYFFGSKNPKNHAPLAQINAATTLLLNTRIPVNVYAQIARSNAVPRNLHRRLSPTAWVRAALLDQPDVAAAVAKEALEAEPRLKRYIDDYSRAQTADEREFAVVFAILHFPGIRPFTNSFARFTDNARIDPYRDNWWCTDVGGDPEESSMLKQYEYGEGRQAPVAGQPAFLSPDQKRQAAMEWKRLHLLGIAQQYMPRVVLQWARKHPEDPRIPEALHYAERAVHLGCDDGKENRYGRDVFRLLHKSYPGSEWAKKTPLWYGMTLESSGTCSTCNTGGNTEPCPTK